MITRQVIKNIYKKYNKLPESPDCLDMALLFETVSEHHKISVDINGPVEYLIINSVDEQSPFHSIPLERIYAIIPFEEWVAIVLHSSIIFLNRDDERVCVNIREEEPSIFERIRNFFNRQ